MLRRVHREASNLDIEFAEIDEVRAGDEASPLLALGKGGGKERHMSVYLGEDQRLNANLQQAVLEMSKAVSQRPPQIAVQPLTPGSSRVSPASPSEEPWPDMVDGERCIKGIPIR